MNFKQKLGMYSVIPVGMTMLLAFPAAAHGNVNWDAIAQCESSGNWHDTAGMYEGGLQFLNSTWLANGGGKYARHAYDASRSEQIAIASKLSLSNWPVCGAHAYDSGHYSGDTTPSTPQKHDSTPTKPYKAPVKHDEKYVAPTNQYNADANYTVVPGDTLSGIAATRNTNWEKIYQDNKKVIGSNPDLIFPGQRFTVK